MAGYWLFSGGGNATQPFEQVLRIFALAPASGSSTAARPPAGPPPAVTVSRPAQREIVEWDEYTGRFEAINAVDIRARVAGYLDTVHVRDGQQVAKGDLLYTIDPRPFERTLDQARAELGQAKTKVENASKDVDRGRTLAASKIMSEKVFDDRTNLKREAEAAVTVAEAKVRTAELDLSFTRISAPISGRMSRSLLTAGNYVTAGGAATPTLLTTIVSQNPMHLYFDVSEANALKYSRLTLSGARGGVGESGAILQLGLPDERDFPHRGTVDFSDNRLDATTGTLRARAVVDNPRGLFSAGMFARARVAGSAAYTAMLLPDVAFGTDQANKFVLVVAEDGSVQRRTVTLGPIVSGLRVVRGGLKNEEWVIIKGLQRARPGQKVNPSREVLNVTDASSQPGLATPTRSP